MIRILKQSHSSIMPHLSTGDESIGVLFPQRVCVKKNGCTAFFSDQLIEFFRD
jgi:hypothetical protein